MQSHLKFHMFGLKSQKVIKIVIHFCFWTIFVESIFFSTINMPKSKRKNMSDTLKNLSYLISTIEIHTKLCESAAQSFICLKN